MTYLGSYSSGLSTATIGNGVLTPGPVVEGVPNASWLACSTDRRFLYVTNESSPEGRVTAVDLRDPDRPVVLGSQPSLGDTPTHLCVHPGGRYLLTANYGSGSVVVHPRSADGSVEAPIELVKHAGTEPHAHQVCTDPSGNWVLAVDLGTDSVYVYRFAEATGKLTQHDQVTLAAGAGPRHLAFHPDGRHGYLVTEFRSELTPFSWDPEHGTLRPGAPVETISRDPGTPNHPAEVVVSADGRFCYASNRGDNSVATFVLERDGAAPRLLGTTPTGGDWPRHCTLDEGGHWLYVANQNSGTITWLPRDPASGLLSPAAGSARVEAIAMILP